MTGYWIYYASGGGEDSGSVGPMNIAGTSHTLDNLQDGLTYTITVIAMGKHLPSEASQGTDVQIRKLFLYVPFSFNATAALSSVQPFCLQAI